MSLDSSIIVMSTYKLYKICFKEREMEGASLMMRHGEGEKPRILF